MNESNFNRDELIESILENEEKDIEENNPGYSKTIYLSNVLEILNNLPNENLQKLAQYWYK